MAAPVLLWYRTNPANRRVRGPLTEAAWSVHRCPFGTIQTDDPRPGTVPARANENALHNTGALVVDRKAANQESIEGIVSSPSMRSSQLHGAHPTRHEHPNVRPLSAHHRAQWNTPFSF